MKTIKIALAILSGFILVFSLVTCSDDDECPTCPSITDVELPDLNVYFMMRYERALGVYNMKSAEIIDTIEFSKFGIEEYAIRDYCVSGDGREIILTANQSLADNEKAYVYSTFVYDLETMDLIAAHDAGYIINVSNTGNYVALYGQDSIYFLDGNTYQILFTDTVFVCHGNFLLDDTKFYAAVENSNKIAVFDMGTRVMDTLIEYYDEEGGAPEVCKVAPVDGGNKLYLELYYGYPWTRLISYSVAQDSTLLQYDIVLAGNLSQTPDGNYVVATDPGQCFYDYIGSWNIIFFDIDNDKIASIVPGVGNTNDPVDPGILAFSPDGRYTFVGGDGCFGRRCAIMDNYQHLILETIYFDDTTFFICPSCRKVP